jgi:hypothetical protein
MNRVRIWPVLLVLVPLPGCNAPGKGSSDFTKAVVERAVYKDGGPVFDPSGMAKMERRTITDRDTVAKLASFFPRVGQGKESGIAGGWTAGYWVKFDRADGGGTVNVTVNHKATTWSEGKGDWDAQPGLQEFLDKLFAESADGSTEK